MARRAAARAGDDGFADFAARHLFIRDKTGGIVPLKLNAVQRLVHARIVDQRARTGRVRMLVLKARQPGGGAFPAVAHENALDKLTMMVQELSGRLTRSLRFPVSDPVSLSAVTPNAESRANRYLAFDANGAPVATAGPAGDSSVPVSPFMETMLDDPDAATARATLGLIIGTDVSSHMATVSQEEAAVGIESVRRAWTAERVAQAIAALTPLPRSYLTGYTLSHGGNWSISVGAGAARDDGNAANIVLGSTISKLTSATWTVGTGNGGLDTGTVANNTWYHLWTIRRSDTGIVDALYSTSATSPTMPTNYDQKRRIGAVQTDGSGNLKSFHQSGDLILWNTPVGDFSAAPGGTSGTLRTLSVPTGLKVVAIAVYTWRISATSATNPSYMIVTSPDSGDVTPSATLHSLDMSINHDVVGSTIIHSNSVELLMRTNASGQIRTRNSINQGTIIGTTFGWFDRRGKDN